MRKLVTCVLSVIFFFEGMLFYNHYSYAHHVDQISNSLDKLGEILDGNTSNKPLGASLLGIYEPENDFGDIELRNLTRKIVNSTEYAIENADDITQTKKLKKAVDEIAEVQEREVDMIHNALEKVEADDISQEVETTYHKAVDLKEKVAEASVEIQTAIDNNQETIEIDIITDKDHAHGSGHHEKEEEHSAHTPHSNPNIERIEQQKLEDAAQREANRKRIMLIEEGREAQKAQKMKNKLLKNNQKDMHS
jgi:hypothetical protein